MMIVYAQRASSSSSCTRAFEAAREAGTQTILVDEFLKDAIEVDVDCRRRRQALRHRRRDAAHRRGGRALRRQLERAAAALAAAARSSRASRSSRACSRSSSASSGLMNVQFAVKGGEVYILEVNPRASRTVPFVSKATGRPLAKIAALLMVGKTLDELGIHDRARAAAHEREGERLSVREVPGRRHDSGPRDALDGRGHGHRGHVRARVRQGDARERHRARRCRPPDSPRRGAFVSVKDEDKPAAIHIARRLSALGLRGPAPRGARRRRSSRANIAAKVVQKVNEGSPHVVDTIRSGTVAIVVNTTIGAKEVRDSYSLRRQTLLANIPYFTTIAAALAACDALEAAQGDAEVRGAVAPGVGRTVSDRVTARRAPRARAPRRRRRLPEQRG